MKQRKAKKETKIKRKSENSQCVRMIHAALLLLLQVTSRAN